MTESGDGITEDQMPLSEDEQRILQEIEENLSATDPKLSQQISDTTLYRHSARVIKWSTVALVLGLAIMLAALLAIEHHVRKLGRAGLDSLTGSMRNGALRNAIATATQRWR